MLKSKKLWTFRNIRYICDSALKVHVLFVNLSKHGLFCEFFFGSCSNFIYYNVFFLFLWSIKATEILKTHYQMVNIFQDAHNSYEKIPLEN